MSTTAEKRKEFKMAEYNLSLEDLMLVDGFKEAFQSNNEKIVREHLWTNGMDVKNYSYEMVFCQHRTLIGRVVEGLRFSGFERTDKEWLSLGCASLEAHIAACDDSNLRFTLRKMRPEGSTEATFHN
ncbi:thymidylate synthase [Pseudomonas phage vB_PaeM_C2-10_Ab1]|uniref:Uncharacterized protein n=4 Tax=Pakpunavirus TaxID=1921407 RepID=K4RME4_9CAUD|nr:thymidylate synthase [Pseudomonas phage vB_PaeM_C2-10_Ab1]CCM43660.1 hypothetical protein BN405_2-10_Ab1_orf_116 [Pseudomonas phage vB_PaeM_C2-10_Ab1]